MTASLSPVTETEMNSFFDGINQFKHRIATSIVAHAEQVQRIDDLTKIVERLSEQVQALTISVNTLTKERNDAYAERDRAIASERMAFEMAETAERQASQVRAELEQTQIAYATERDKCHGLESVVADLMAMNGRQEQSLSAAIQANQELQSTVKDLRALIEQEADFSSRQRNAINTLESEKAKLLRILSLTKGGLESVLSGVLDEVPDTDKDHIDHNVGNPIRHPFHSVG